MRSANPMVHWCFKALILCVLVGILIVCGFDGVNLGTLRRNYTDLKLNSSNSLARNDSTFTNSPVLPPSENPSSDLNPTHQNLVTGDDNSTSVIAPGSLNSTQTRFNASNFTPEVAENSSRFNNVGGPRFMRWVSAELEANYSSNLLSGWLTPGGEQCRDSRTVEISLLGLDGRDDVELSSGDIHEFDFQALDDSGRPHCLGGDYFETDLAGEWWKSRPPIKDFGNGTYRFSLQVHPDFPGDYKLTIILLFRHYEGLKFSNERFAFDRVLRVIPIKFRSSDVKLPEITQCRRPDLVRDVWSGRWTRHARNDRCRISNDGRYRCQGENFPCKKPWCYGPLGKLESNGWVYSTHCSFKIFSSKEVWNCLSGRWIFWWGDSNHCDTIGNMLNLILDAPVVTTVPRRFDMNISNPRNPSQVVRFTSIFNGHYNDSGNYLGLDSLSNAEYRELLKGYFSGDVVPGTIIMNSGLHDGIHWQSLRHFIKGAEYATAFWADVLDGVRRRGVVPPEVIYRLTVATGGYARRLSFNPNKMEAFNGVVLDKLRKYGLVDMVIDDFDMTYPWHYDNRCNDGVHYGRAPAKMRWRDGEIGHQYFVDLMLGHVLLNALCT